MGMLDDLPRGVRERKSLKNQTTPLSAFVDPERIAKSEVFQYDPSKIFLGTVGGEIRDEDGEVYVSGGVPCGIGQDQHLVLCAGSRSGKGRSCLNPTILSYGLGDTPGSILCLDPKAELCNITARRRAEMGQEVCILDPFNIAAERLNDFKTGFNPLEILRLGNPDNN